MTLRNVVLAAAALALVPASGLASPAPAAKATPATTKAAPAAAPANRPMVFPYIHDDYAKAVADAKAHKVPIFVDAGAAWCHTCRSMDAFVFTDERLKKHAGRFTWLAINTENRKNADFLKKNSIPALPTYLVIDPLTDKVVMRWVGGASVAQLEQFFDDADVALHGGKPHEPYDVAVTRADEAYGKGQHAEAVAAYREALAAAPEGWASYTRCVEAMLFSLSSLDSNQAVIDFARAVIPQVRQSPTYISAAGSALSSAIALPDSNPKKQSYIEEFEANLREGLSDGSIPMAYDDRSSYLSMLMDARQAAHDSAGAQAATQDWSDFLERAARESKTPEERAVFDPHRLSAYIELGEVEKAVPMLQLSEKEFPEDCNPPARLATAYLKLKRYDDALAASDRAMAKPMADGPRRLLYYQTRIDILTGKGDTAAAKKTLEQEIVYAQALPAAQVSPERIAGLKKKLEKMGQTTSAQ
jgi:tetratricopeptide (TPR) repeat protein